VPVQAQLPQDDVVPDGDPVLADGADGQLLAVRSADLAHDDDVQLCFQGVGDLGRDGHAAPRQPHDDGSRGTQVSQHAGELAAGGDPVPEAHDVTSVPSVTPCGASVEREYYRT
jgi:hypothetical protein